MIETEKEIRLQGNLFIGLNNLIKNEINTYEEMKSKMSKNMQRELENAMECIDGYITNLRLLRDIGLSRYSLIQIGD